MQTLTDKDYQADDRAVVAEIRRRMAAEDAEKERQERLKWEDRKAAHAHATRRQDR